MSDTQTTGDPARTRRVGVLGLGTMGRTVAARLLDAGLEVWVHNRTAARAENLVASGAHWAPSGAELAARVDLLLTLVADDDALRHVTTGPDGVLSAARPGLVYADMSTVSPEASADVAAAADAVGVPYVRAPLMGSTVLARSGQLGVLASGPAAGIDAFGVVLDAIGRRVFRLGEAEEARVMKLAVNTMIAQTTLAMSEALDLGRRSGLGWQQMLDVIGDSPVASPLVKYKSVSLAARDFGVAFATSMVVKDLGLALDAARRSGAVLPATAQAHELFRAVAALGHGGDDLSAAVLLYEQLGGPGPDPAA